MTVDLHCHSTASDGALTPAALVRRAGEQGITRLALTDHDTIEGLAEARCTAAALGIQLINGVELSCCWQGMTLHVLGYAFASEAPALVQATRTLHEGRWQRARTIAGRLARHGMPGTLEGARAIQQALGDSSNAPARPHFAEYLVQEGFVRDRQEAFRKWLGAGRLGDVKQHWPTLEQTMETLRHAGAWISLAHPWQYDMTGSKRRRLVQEFARLGGHALEVVNGLQPVEQLGPLARLTREAGLMASAGSDFHAPAGWSELGLFRPLPPDLSPLYPHLQRRHDQLSTTRTQGAA